MITDAASAALTKEVFVKVMATKFGIDGVYTRKPGDIFEISDERNEAGEVMAFSKKWMREVETTETSKQE